ncbi:MAG: hypothetical protein K8G79_04075 [bacterium]|uniref:Uncharacterized protein n=2 Tax=Candidatus Methylomirabilis TaxID=1170227 RepID=A0AAJ1AGV9_9BACT|nr:hypothetical protein [Candidatus Methylomirabilis sp.]
MVIFENGTAFSRSTLDDLENRRLVAGAAAEAFGRPLTVEYRFGNSSNPPAVSSLTGLTTGGSAGLVTGQGELRQPPQSGGARHRPRDLQQRAVSEQSIASSDPSVWDAQAGQEALRRHPLVQRAVELFDGQIVRVRAKQPE